MTRILCGNHVDLAQDTQGTRRDVFEITERGGYNVQRPWHGGLPVPEPPETRQGSVSGQRRGPLSHPQNGDHHNRNRGDDHR